MQLVHLQYLCMQALTKQRVNAMQVNLVISKGCPIFESRP